MNYCKLALNTISITISIHDKYPLLSDYVKNYYPSSYYW